MTTPVIALPLSARKGIPAKKKRVLLLDTSQTKRDLRADVMKKLGIDVDCAADVLEARCWWRADLYSPVLINVAGSQARSRATCETPRPSRWAEAIEQHSAPEITKPQPLFAAEIVATETERAELV
jgi:hypothetical protein